jgi:hypothetical protein
MISCRSHCLNFLFEEWAASITVDGKKKMMHNDAVMYVLYVCFRLYDNIKSFINGTKVTTNKHYFDIINV